jgi:hypothetical protein
MVVLARRLTDLSTEELLALDARLTPNHEIAPPPAAKQHIH